MILIDYLQLLEKVFIISKCSKVIKQLKSIYSMVNISMLNGYIYILDIKKVKQMVIFIGQEQK